MSARICLPGIAPCGTLPTFLPPLHTIICIVVFLVLSPFSSQALGQTSKENAQMIDSLKELPVGLGILPLPDSPPDNLQTRRKINLGRRLFFDRVLSSDRSMSCGTCHDPAKGFSDGRRRAIGFHGHALPRHTPSIWNAAYNSSQFWDGRAASLEEQASGPMMSATEMNAPKEPELTERLEADARYRRDFEAVFGERPTIKNLAKAIAAFERTVVTSGSRFDHYARGQKNALGLQEKNGLVLFIGKARCARCHNGPNFTDNKFQNIGTGSEEDPGRYSITHLEQDRGAFKTPSLRNAALHAPYMHDGSAATLDAVIDYYDRGGNEKQGKSPFMMKIGLTPQEKHDLIAFLKTLTDTSAIVAKPSK